MVTRLLGLVITAFTVATLPALASATPPDQTWVRGLYDNGDYDDVVILATSASSTQAQSPASRIEPLRSLVSVVLAPVTPRITDSGLTAHVPRGPPHS